MSEPTFDAIIPPPEKIPYPIVVSNPHSSVFLPKEYDPGLPADITHFDMIDLHVEKILDRVPHLNIPLLTQLVSRYIIDVNKGLDEIHPSQVRSHISPDMYRATPNTRNGLGLIPKMVRTKSGIQNIPGNDNLSLDEIERRISEYYQPYRTALNETLSNIHREFGMSLLLDIHTMWRMPYRGLNADIVLGHRDGLSCCPEILDSATQFLQQKGLTVQTERFYQGGNIIQSHFNLSQQKHALQIEFANDLLVSPPDSFDADPDKISFLNDVMLGLIEHLGEFSLERLAMLREQQKPPQTHAQEPYQAHEVSSNGPTL